MQIRRLSIPLITAGTDSPVISVKSRLSRSAHECGNCESPLTNQQKYREYHQLLINSKDWYSGSINDRRCGRSLRHAPTAVPINRGWRGEGGEGPPPEGPGSGTSRRITDVSIIVKPRSWRSRFPTGVPRRRRRHPTPRAAIVSEGSRRAKWPTTEGPTLALDTHEGVVAPRRGTHEINNRNSGIPTRTAEDIIRILPVNVAGPATRFARTVAAHPRRYHVRRKRKRRSSEL